MKKIYILLTVFHFSIFSLFAQQIPFQGKLLENGMPVSGQRNFTFSINIGNINWTESHPSEVVTNGLYALVLGQNTPLPADLFEAQNSVPLAIQVNGQNLPTTTLYAPFESDPTIPNNLKDGVSWEEISDKPSIDTSNTNEIQQLSILGDSLSLSDANKVKLPSTSSPTDSFQVGMQDTTIICAVEQNLFDGSITLNNVWQSFQMIEEGLLESIQVNFSNLTNIDIRLRIYEGAGISTQALYDITYNATEFTSSLELQTFDIISNATFNLQSGNDYTFYIQGISDDLTFRRNSNNPYVTGQSSIASDTDLVFKINIEQISDYTFEVTSNTTTINTPLIVNDRIKDKTGLVMPVGAIIPFGGATPPEGWLLCNGKDISRELYADLFAVIGTNWGSDGGNTTFNLPDLRGQFLRGVSTSSSVDPDAAFRSARHSGGNTGNNVGSYQTDEFKAHRHVSIEWKDGAKAVNDAIYGLGDFTTNGKEQSFHPSQDYINMTGSTGGSETRPKNAYVNFIIKY
ncbi:MAG: tail fiber protein [Bacteroidota bacterium]